MLPSSTISLLEVPVAHLIDAWGWKRPRAVVVVASVTFLLAVPSVLAKAPPDERMFREPGVNIGRFFAA